MEFQITPEKIYQATDNGLDIFKDFCTEGQNCIGNRKMFRLREDENTPSACFYKPPMLPCWIIKDFGSGESINPISYIMKKKRLEFKEALHFLAEQYNICEKNPVFAKNIEFKDKGTLPDNYFKITTKPLTDATIINRFVTPQICELYNVHCVEKLERITTGSKKLMTTTASENYPIFAYSPDIESWAKIYAPTERKKTYTKVVKTTGDGQPLETRTEVTNFKHQYLGKKPPFYLHGLQRIEKELEKRKKIVEEKNSDKQLSEQEIEKIMLLPYIFIVSGGSDGLTLASLCEDFFPVWTNSEGDRIPPEVYKFLNENTKNLINIPDTDPSGIAYAHAYSKAYWRLKTCFLPQSMLKEKGKDFRDFVETFPQKTTKETICYKFKNLLNSPISCDFVEHTTNNRYRINSENLFYFFSVYDLYVYTSPYCSTSDNENKGKMVSIDAYKVTFVESSQIRDFCVDFLRKNGACSSQIDLVRTCQALEPARLKNAYKKEINFTKSAIDYQLFFFENTCVRVSTKGIETLPATSTDAYVLSSAIIPHKFYLIEKPFFQYKKQNGRYLVTSYTSSCDFMSFLINTSRVHWRKEQDYWRKKGTPQRLRDILLSSPALDDQQTFDHSEHFLSKCYALGYLLHRFCVADFQKFIYIMDDEIKSGGGANGGTGKSLFTKALSQISRVFEMNGKDKNLFSDKHKYDGLDESHDIIVFNDLAQTDFKNFYNDITDGIAINAKNEKKKYIPYDKAPKIVGTFNYGLKNPDGSDLRRIFFLTFSSYYHSQSEAEEQYQPRSDFKNLFFFQWDNQQYNQFFNFCLFCCKFYIDNIENPFNAPTSSIERNNLLASLPENFVEWADYYLFSEEFEFNTEVAKDTLYDNYRVYIAGSGIKPTPTSFKKNLIKYCKLKGFVFNPEGMCDREGRIIKWVMGKTTEFIYIQRQDNMEKSREKNNVEIPF